MIITLYQSHVQGRAGRRIWYCNRPLGLNTCQGGGGGGGGGRIRIFLLPPSSAKVRNVQSYTSICPASWCGTKAQGQICILLNIGYIKKCFKENL